MHVNKIISGGQTGVDRAALDVARALKIDRGGWCPQGRLAEDGRIPDDYPLHETASAQYSERTERNVLDSDGTLILTIGVPTGGTAYTIACARRHAKPYRVVDLTQSTDAGAVQGWLRRHAIAVLNVAGPRLSESPEGYALASHLLMRVLGETAMP
jgi:hypothetical protein